MVNASAEIELLFYLVRGDSAQRLCRSLKEKFALKFQKALSDATEQVPKYSDAGLQVPYNQQLGQVFFRY